MRFNETSLHNEAWIEFDACNKAVGLKFRMTHPENLTQCEDTAVQVLFDGYDNSGSSVEEIEKV